ncbi:MAG: glycosyltransferase family 2 protein, partial [Patescibacteria group bacterium]
MKPSLSIVVLAYNEEKNIADCLNKVDTVLRNLSREYEIIVVSEGSKDKTTTIVKNLTKKIKNIRLIESEENNGYGGAWKTGVYAAKKDLTVIIHSDNQFDFSEVKMFLQKMDDENADMVIGTRVYDKDPLNRRINRWLWNTLVRGMFGYLATDIDCGFKVFKSKIVKGLNLTSNGALLDTQLLANIRMTRAKIVEIPVTHLPRLAGNSTGANLKVITKALQELFVYWWELKHEIMVERGLAIFRWEAILIGVILLIASFTRLYKIDQYMTFLG